MIHAVGPSPQRQWENCSELGRLLSIDVTGRGSVVVATRRLRTINTGAPFDHVEIEFQNALLAEDQFRHRDKCQLGALAEDRAARSEEQVFYQLLRKRGASTNAAAFHIVFRSVLNRLPIESTMLVEARVFSRDDSMLEIGGDLAQRNEFVSFLIRRVVNQGLQAALHVYCGGRWVDPSGSHEDQHSEQPKKRCSEKKPSNKRSEKAFPKPSLGLCARIFSHISE